MIPVLEAALISVGAGFACFILGWCYRGKIDRERQHSLFYLEPPLNRK